MMLLMALRRFAYLLTLPIPRRHRVVRHRPPAQRRHPAHQYTVYYAGYCTLRCLPPLITLRRFLLLH